MKRLLVLSLILITHLSFSQETIKEEYVPVIKPRGYFRYAMPFSLNKGELGYRLNLEGLGGLGGRHQEGDWLEIGTEMDLNRIMKWDIKPVIKLYTLFSMFPTTGSYMHLGTKIGIQELYLTIEDTLKNTPIQFWAGTRYYRTNNIEACDYFNFNNLTGPTIGLKVKNTELAFITDAPFYNNPKSQYGTSIDPFRGRVIVALQHQLQISKKHKIDLLGEYHYAGWDVTQDTTGRHLSEGVDWGTVLGLRHHWQITPNLVNRASVRRGWRIANGPKDDNWSSRTFVSVGNPNAQNNFHGANAWHLTNNMQYTASNLLNFEAYVIYRKAKGADNAIDFDNAPNQKEDFTAGSRITWFLSDKFHFITEGSWQKKKYYKYKSNKTRVSAAGDAAVSQFAIGPMYNPTGKRSMFTRPTFRLIYAVALYNDYGVQERISDYLANVPDSDVGHYLGIKTEFWF